ncbi:MAG: hypothetical protein PHV47_00490 [Candidatus Pacebacteria bacterium]|nr:hypothetical protein [Candidatus Paceibacterota bacterium]
MKILAEIKRIVKQNKDAIYLGLLVFLTAMFVFSCVWIIINKSERMPLEFQYSKALKK